MKNPFQVWLASQPVPSEARSLFDESFLCYQVGAQRAALVFSWLGLMRVLARRVLAATRPTDFPERSWGKLQADLRNDKEWERAIVDAVNRKPPASIFFADDDLRAQLQYWRGRRNDCVHFRGNVVDGPHVEALWLFIRSNLSKLVVLGGSAELLERFKLHYDISYTPPHKSAQPLVQEIPQAVRPIEYRDFLSQLLIIAGIGRESYDRWADSLRCRDMINSIQRVNDPELTEALAIEVRANLELLIRVIHAIPEFLLNYGDDPAFIRKLWHDILPFGFLYHDDFEYVRDSSLRVVATMIRTGLVPDSEVEEVWDKVLDKLSEDDTRSGPSLQLQEELEPTGFLRAIEQRAFSSHADIDWAHSNLGLCIDYLRTRPMTKFIAKTFIELAPRVQVEDLGNLWGAFNYSDWGQRKYDEILEVARVEGLNCREFEKILGPAPQGEHWEGDEMQKPKPG